MALRKSTGIKHWKVVPLHVKEDGSVSQSWPDKQECPSEVAKISQSVKMFPAVMFTGLFPQLSQTRVGCVDIL